VHRSHPRRRGLTCGAHRRRWSISRRLTGQTRVRSGQPLQTSRIEAD
jgi:hypothetical protein